MSSVRFGPCELDLDARQLFRHGQPIRLSPKAFELLKVLVEARPRAFSKAELHDRIWPGTFVTDDSLTRLVAEIRTATGDDARTPAFVRTVHAFGYAFSSPVEGAQPTRAAAEPRGWIVFEGRAIGLAEGENIIGRDPGARVTLDSIKVSRLHARITVNDLATTLEDLGSRNGTSVNNQKISGPVQLTDGDEIAIGGFTVKFRAGGSAAPTAADSGD